MFVCRLFSVLGGVASGEVGVDMRRMLTMIRRSILKNLESLEQNPDYYFAFGIIGDFLFADKAEEVREQRRSLYSPQGTPAPPVVCLFFPGPLPLSAPPPSPPPSLQFAVHLDKVPHLKQLLTEPEVYWRELLRHYFIEAPHIMVRPMEARLVVPSLSALPVHVCVCRCGASPVLLSRRR